MPITQPTIDDFQDTTVMRVIRKVVNYLVTLIPKVNEEIANVTDSAGERLDTVEANVEALNKELPTDIRVNYTPSTGNFSIDYVKEDGDVLTSNTVVIVSGTTGEVTIVQNTSGISINGTALQSATTAQPGLMTPALVSSLNNVNDTTNDHTTMLNAQAEAITALDDRVDALEQAGGGGTPSFSRHYIAGSSGFENAYTLFKNFIDREDCVGKRFAFIPTDIKSGIRYEGSTLHQCEFTCMFVDRGGERPIVHLMGTALASAYSTISGGITKGGYVCVNGKIELDSAHYLWLDTYAPDPSNTDDANKVFRPFILLNVPNSYYYLWIEN